MVYAKAKIPISPFSPVPSRTFYAPKRTTTAATTVRDDTVQLVNIVRFLAKNDWRFVDK